MPKSNTGKKNRRHIKNRKPTANNQRKQILRNQNQITALKQKLKEIRQPVTWRMGFEHATLAPNNSARGPLIIPLTSGPSNTGTPALLNNSAQTSCAWKYTMTPSIQNAPQNKSKCFLGTQYVDLSIESGSEPATQRYTVYLVQLKDDTAQATYDDTISMGTMDRDIHYACPDVNGGTGPSFYGPYLNPRAFKILKKYILQTQSTADDAISSVARGVGVVNNQVCRLMMKFSYGNTKLKAIGDNAPSASPTASADLDDISYSDIAPHKKRFIVVFTDDINEDVNSATVSLSSIITGHTA